MGQARAGGTLGGTLGPAEAYLDSTSSTVTKRNDVDTALSRVVTDVAAGSPAASAGLKAADRIADVDGAAASAPVLNDAINARKPGEKIKLHVVRDGAPIEVEVEVARNVKRTYRLAAAAGATAGQTAILDDWLRKGL